eukprot:5229801-Pleurochrysis_carterae.AAC.1
MCLCCASSRTHGLREMVWFQSSARSSPLALCRVPCRSRSTSALPSRRLSAQVAASASGDMTIKVWSMSSFSCLCAPP